MLRVQGVRRFTMAGADWARAKFGKPSPAQAEYRAHKARVDAAFDAARGVTTGGVEYLHDLTILGENARFGTNHVASDPAEFEAALARVDVDLGTATFIDFGSGRGRALILAAKLPFRKIIGLEFAHELHAASLTNIARACPGESGRITPILGDATTFAFPDDPLVLYLYNPFDEPIVAQVARNAFASWQGQPRPVRIVYLNPVFSGAWTEAGWRLVEDGMGRAIYAPPSA